MKKIIKKEYTLNRSLPENFSEKDRKHFQEDLKVIIKENHLAFFKNSSVIQSFLISNFNIQRDYCLSRKISFEKEFKVHIKNILFSKRKVNNGIWVLDQWSSCYFHWFTEVLPRIILAEEFGDNSPVLLPVYFERSNFMNESLDIFKREIILYNSNEKLIVANLIAPSHHQPAQYDSFLIKRVRDRFREFDKINFSLRGNKKVYVSRSKSNRRFVFNEEVLQSFLHENGFVTVFMEDLTFFEQRKLMAETQVLISNHGAGLTNMLFMKENSQIIELKADSDDINNCFFNLARTLNHKYFYTINEGDNKGIQKANIKVDIEALNSVLQLIK